MLAFCSGTSAGRGGGETSGSRFKGRPVALDEAGQAMMDHVSDEPIRFEMDRLLSYDRESVIAELQRVAELIDGPVTRSEFDQHARVDSSTVLRKLGDWRTALEAAGLGDRYSGKKVSRRMRTQPSKDLSDDELLAEMRRVAEKLGGRTLTQETLRAHSDVISDSAVVRRFGSWPEAVRRAGLELSRHGRRWTEDDYFENMLTVWTHYGRPPTYAEMNRPPSRITKNAYAAKWGTWGRAKAAFVERVNADLDEPALSGPAPKGEEQLRLPDARAQRPRTPPEDRRDPSIGLRYKVLSRDRFRCAACGRSPATDLAVSLHVDHVIPVAAGGKTTEQNLRALCADCNIGKGAKIEAPPSETLSSDR